MKLLLLADINSVHIKKWARSFAERNIETGIYSLSAPHDNWYESHGIKLLSPKDSSATSRLSYFFHANDLKQCITAFVPDIVHAHYATSYGMLLRNSGFHPGVLSVWGSDILVFPKKSFIRRILLKKNLRYADVILATGESLKKETSRYVKSHIGVVPFGVDTSFFKPSQQRDESTLMISTAKALEKIYGIDLLIDVFAALRKKYNHIYLTVAGDGTMKQHYINQVNKLGLDKFVTFTGKLTPEQVAELYGISNIAAFLSVSESFGVSVLEASACGLPVISSAVGGFKDVIKDNETGFLVNRNEKNALIEKFSLLIENKDLRLQMGKQGRDFVVKEFEWKTCVDEQIKVYQSLLEKQ